MPKVRTIDYGTGFGKTVVPQYGAIPPRPAHFKYRSYLSGGTDYNQLEWAAVSTSLVDHFVIEVADTYNGTFTVLAASVSNDGTAQVYSITSQVSGKWFRIKAVNSVGYESLYAGPIENRKPGRTVTVKGYLKDLNDDPNADGIITVKLNTSSKFITLNGYQTVEIVPEIVQPEADTGFWEIRLFSSNEFDADNPVGYLFTLRGKTNIETTVAKVAPDGSSEDVWFSELANA